MGLADWFQPEEGATALSSDNSYVVDRTHDTATVDALQGSAPIESAPRNAWSDALLNSATSLFQYALTKDAVRSGIQSPGASAPTSPYVNTSPNAMASAPRWLVPALLLGVGVGAVIWASRK